MTFYEYTTLSKEEQFDLVFIKGNFIGFKKIDSKTYILYQLYEFYVEVVYNHELNRIENLVCSINDRV